MNSSNYLYSHYSNKRFVAGSLLAGISTVFVGNGLTVSLFPSLATVPPATVAALTGLAVVFAAALLYKVGSGITTLVEARNSEQDTTQFVAQAVKSEEPFFSFTDMLWIAVAASAAAATAVAMPQLLLSAGANLSVVVKAANPVVQFILPSVALAVVNAGFKKLVDLVAKEVAMGMRTSMVVRDTVYKSDSDGEAFVPAPKKTYPTA